MMVKIVFEEDINIMPIKNEIPSSKRFIPGIILFSVTVVSMSLLAFEISLTRLLSIMLSYHYVYGVTSLAMLGSGIGGFVVHYFFKTKSSVSINDLSKKIVLQISLVSITMISSVLLVIQMNKLTMANGILLGLLLCVPFFFEGMLLANLFKYYPLVSGKLYFSDLLGAALGCVLVVISLNVLGDIESILLFSFLTSIISILISFFYKSKKSILISGSNIIILILILLTGALNSNFFLIPVGTNIEKEIYDSLNEFDGEIIETKSSAFGRSDLIQYESIKEHMDIYLDGTAGSPMYKFNGDIENPNEEVLELKDFPGFLPLEHLLPEEKDNALIIGSGGGRDVLIALMGGIKEVTAIEVNPDLIEIVENHSSYNGGIYSDLDNVELVVDEGRSYLRSQKDKKYDIIMMTLPKTNTSRSVEGYALTENYLFTSESIDEYLNSLNENGHLIIVAHDDAEILRLLTLTLSVFKDKDIKEEDAMDHMYIVGSSPNPVFVLKNGVFNEGISQEIYDNAVIDKGYNPTTSFFPKSNNKMSNLNPLFLMLDDGKMDLESLVLAVKNIGYDIEPVSDNSPFFYKLNIGLPESIKMVLILSALLILLMVVFLLLAEFNNKDNKKGKLIAQKTDLKDLTCFVINFAMMGIGYMVIEISLIQKFVFFLGKPVLSMTVILFTVLLGSGIGSYISNLAIKRNTVKTISRVSGGIISLLLIYNYLVIPFIFDNYMSLQFSTRATISIIVLLPLSIIMGMPFPLMIRKLNQLIDDNFIPWMWGINAVSSVFGSVFSMAVAITFGYNQAILVGGLCYLILTISSHFLRNPEDLK